MVSGLVLSDRVCLEGSSLHSVESVVGVSQDRLSWGDFLVASYVSLVLFLALGFFVGCSCFEK